MTVVDRDPFPQIFVATCTCSQPNSSPRTKYASSLARKATCSVAVSGEEAPRDEHSLSESFE